MLLMLRLMLELWVGICFRVVQTLSIVINLTNIIFRIICNVGFALNQFGGGALLHLYYTSSVSFSQSSLLFLKMLMIECTWCSVPQYLLQYSHSLHFLSPFLNYPFFYLLSNLSSCTFSHLFFLTHRLIFTLSLLCCFHSDLIDLFI